MAKWKELKRQILAGTKIDSQGESNTKEFLVSLCKSFNSRGRIPLGQQHDMSLEDVGYIDNFNVIPDGKDNNHWNLVGDIYFHDIDIDDALRGFSYSVNQDLAGDLEKKEVAVYVPFPFYNDHELLNEIAGINNGVVSGAWKKKNADPASLSLIISFALFLGAPAYTNYWNNKIEPAYKKLRAHLGKKHGIDFVQTCKGPNGETYGIYFIHAREDEDSCFSLKNVLSGIQLVENHILNDNLAKEKGINLVKLQYSEENKIFKLRVVEYLDGSIIKH